MRTLAVPAALALFALTACSTTAPEEQEQAPADQGQQPTQDAETDPMAPGQAALDETHDFGDGFTLRITDLHRDTAPDAFNSMTGEEGDLPYVGWTFEATNNSGAAVTTGNVTNSCSAGDPLQESEGPNLGEALNPPEMLQDGQSATWSGDCYMAEDQSQLQFTIQFYDDQDIGLYPPVTFAGDVPA